MNSLALFFTVSGIIGVSASTFGTPLFAWLLSQTRRRKKNPREDFLKKNTSLAIEVLIPAYNEERLILKTLDSLQQARNYTRADFSVRIGLDHCTDQTASVIQEWAKNNTLHVETTINPEKPGKWNTLHHLTRQSNADWVVLMDVGSVWERGLLNECLHRFSDPRLIAIAPSYEAGEATQIERLSWKLEQALKKIESEAGGPTSVHGATVMYRRKYLRIAFEALKNNLWLNDDVVIPLFLRTRWPEMRIEYLTSERKVWVKDYGIQSIQRVEIARRKRMVLGNMEWIMTLFIPALRSDPVVGIIASRRVFRTFWAYWALFLAIGILLQGWMGLGLLFSGYFILRLLKKDLGRLSAAFFAGLQVPFHWINAQPSTEKIWN